MLTTIGGTMMPMPKLTPEPTSTEPLRSVVSRETEP